MDDDRYERIKRRAYEIWEQEGYVDGVHGEHWRRAELEIGESEMAMTSDKPGGTAGKSRPHHGDKPGTTGERANVAKTDTDFTVLPDGTVLPIPSDRK